MNYPTLVRDGKPAQDLHGVIGRLARRKPTGSQAITQSLAFKKFVHDVERTLVRAGIEDREDIRVVELGQSLRFLAEAAEPVRIFREVRGKYFDSHISCEIRV